MGATTRFLMLLTTTTPSPLLHHHRHRYPSLLRLTRHRLSPSLTPHSHHHRHLSTTPTPHFPTKSSSSSSSSSRRRQLHTQTASAYYDSSSPKISHHPWPEFSTLLNNLFAAGYFNPHNRTISGGEFVAGPILPEEFVNAANTCLAFARDRWNLLGMVSRRDVEVLVQHGTPFLFKNGEESVRRLRLFLGTAQSNVLGTDKANTVDLMRFLLSYASNVTVSSEVNNLYNRELVESSVRNLLFELAKLSCSTSESNLSGSVQSQFPDRYGQTTRPYGQNIEMKRGDWICPRCDFMNFARNVKCLECEEARPKRQLTGGEWECPQCDFYNYGRNMVCLRCDCKRPGEVSLGTANSRSGGSVYGNGSYENKVDVDSRLAANEEKAQRWFSKVSQLDVSSDMSSEIADEDFPEIMPLRKGVNRFVVSTRKTPLERRLANAQYQRNLGNDGTLEGNDLQTGGTSKSLDTTVSRSLDEILGRSSAVSESNNNSITTGQKTVPFSNAASPQYGNPRGSNSNYVPFVPLPADMFAKKPENSKMEDGEKTVSGNYQANVSNTGEKIGAVSGGNEYGNSGDNLQISEKAVNQNDSEDKEKEQAEKSERWFKRVAELHNVTDLASAVSDEDFPDIMPMRKGENRFVVSKKKDRSLTSPVYKRRVAMEQTSNNNFVPFSPDHFAKKDNQQPEGADSTTKMTGETSNSATPEKLDDARPGELDRNHVQLMENQQISSGSWNSKPSGENSNEIRTGAAYVAPTSGSATQNIINPQRSSQDNWSSGYSGRANMNDTTNLTGNSPQPSENLNIRNSWTGKSLEGSAVKEPDPLDMSEEAKAERWFRRVAQIKDISELSQIPDEDFPSIMPMRKGVNRFVVSKRKTPLERRLTFQQYRKNLPVVSSDPLKKENDDN